MGKVSGTSHSWDHRYHQVSVLCFVPSTNCLRYVEEFLQWSLEELVCITEFLSCQLILRPIQVLQFHYNHPIPLQAIASRTKLFPTGKHFQVHGRYSENIGLRKVKKCCYHLGPVVSSADHLNFFTICH